MLHNMLSVCADAVQRIVRCRLFAQVPLPILGTLTLNVIHDNAGCLCSWNPSDLKNLNLSPVLALLLPWMLSR